KVSKGVEDATYRVPYISFRVPPPTRRPAKNSPSGIFVALPPPLEPPLTERPVPPLALEEDFPELLPDPLPPPPPPLGERLVRNRTNMMGISD
ncbi:hypothetical protein H0H87_003399, partial [Tephrocybe sp. NHM501043]